MIIGKPTWFAAHHLHTWGVPSIPGGWRFVRICIRLFCIDHNCRGSNPRDDRNVFAKAPVGRWLLGSIRWGNRSCSVKPHNQPSYLLDTNDVEPVPRKKVIPTMNRKRKKINKIRRAWINRMLSNVWSVFFFTSKSAEFLHVASDSLEKHCPAFFFARLSFFCKKKRIQKTCRQPLHFFVRIANKRNLLTCSGHCLDVGNICCFFSYYISYWSLILTSLP